MEAAVRHPSLLLGDRWRVTTCHAASLPSANSGTCLPSHAKDAKACAKAWYREECLGCPLLPLLALPQVATSSSAPCPQPVAAFAFVLFAILPLSFLSGVSGDSRRWTTFGPHVGCARWGLGGELRDATSDSVRTKMKGNPLNRALARDMEARQHDTANNSACRFDPSILEANSTPSVGKMSSTGTAKTSARRE